MKKYIGLMAFLLMATCSLYAQQTDYRVVFDMSTRDSVSQQAVIRELDIIRNGNPAAKLEVVVYGAALSLILKDKSRHAADITRILADTNTSFKVCAITMKRNNADASQLIPGVKMVPDGIYEIITKQREGWGYIKVAH